MKKRVKEPASSAELQPDTSPRKSSRGRHPLSRKNRPKYTQSEQALLLTFLGAYLAEATHSLQQTRELCKGTDPDFPGRKTLEYWDHVCAAIGWLSHKVPLRQEHLLIAKLIETNPELFNQE